jgi:hypothetical protein
MLDMKQTPACHLFECTAWVLLKRFDRSGPPVSSGADSSCVVVGKSQAFQSFWVVVWHVYLPKKLLQLRRGVWYDVGRYATRVRVVCSGLHLILSHIWFLIPLFSGRSVSTAVPDRFLPNPSSQTYLRHQEMPASGPDRHQTD